MAPLGVPLSLQDAYKIQSIHFEAELASGKSPCGYKMGLTSRAKQIDVNVFEPIRGYLLRDMEIVGPLTPDRFVQPRCEPEVAVILRSKLKAPLSVRDVIPALSAIVPAIEVLDSRFENYRFSIAEVVADNCSAAGFVLGKTNLLSQAKELSLMGVVVKKNGQIVETGVPAAVLGDPLLSVVSLVQSLTEDGREVEPGQVILTGGITASVPFSKGDVIEVLWPQETLILK